MTSTAARQLPAPVAGASAPDRAGTEPEPARSPRRERREATRALLEQMATSTDELTRRRLRNEVVRLNLDVADTLTSRFRNRGVASEDLSQVAYLGLVAAVERFDPAYGRDFLSFAIPTIRGEVKRHFRDQGWTIRPPRKIQELQAEIAAGADSLTQELGRSPRPSEVAAALGADESDVIEAMAASGCFTPTSLDLPVGPSQDLSLGDLLPQEDEEGSAAEARVMLGPAIRCLGERDRRILYLRFIEDRNQSEIGAEIGVSQMQVSRLLTRILRDLRRHLTEAPRG